MSKEVDALIVSVTALTTVAQSTEALLTRLSQMVKDAGQDPVALKAVTDSIDQNVAALSAAVTANTPAANPANPANVQGQPVATRQRP